MKVVRRLQELWGHFRCLMGYHSFHWEFPATATVYRCRVCGYIEKSIPYNPAQFTSRNYHKHKKIKY